MELCLQNKVIVITGNGKGNTENLIRVLSDEGAILVIVGRNVYNHLNLKQEIEISGSKVILVEAELGHPAECENAVRNIIQKYGCIDGLVNDAGVNEGMGLDLSGIFLQCIQKNLVHYYLMTHFVLPYLKKTKGAIVNVSFILTETDQGNSAVYTVSTGGINALTREWAVELLKYGIRVNSVIVKECVPEIANVVAFLLSQKSSHTTGQLIRYSG
jgi:L-fucose dehydrogenase